MTSTTHYSLALIGCGYLFEDIAANWRLLGAGKGLIPLHLASTDAATDDTAALLADLDPAHTRIFAAVDSQAINHARLDVYGKARLLGFRADSLQHPSAIVADGVRVGENCWIGAGAVIAQGAQIGHNTIIGDAARIEANVKIGANCWIGPGASIGAGAALGPHCVIGRDVHLGTGMQLGRYCVIDVPNAYDDSLADGTFIDPLFKNLVCIYGIK